MKRLRKTVSFTATASEAQGSLRRLFIEQPMAYFREARERMRDLPKSNYDLACQFASQGKWFDAVFRFRMALMLKPDYPHANYNLGGCYMRMGRLADAKAALQKALRQDPGHAEAQFMLASIDPNVLPANQRPTQMPIGMVTGFFTNNAQSYDVTEAGNKYQGGAAVHAFAKPLVKVTAPVILDLGAGTGIAARPWRGEASRIHGIEITPAMAELAKAATHHEKKLYDEVTVADARALPATVTSAAADLVLLINTAQFLGDLAAVMQSAATALVSEGVLVMTVEPGKQAAGYGVSPSTGHFTHSPDYVKRCATDAGLHLVAESTLELYPRVPALVFAFSKGARA